MRRATATRRSSSMWRRADLCRRRRAAALLAILAVGVGAVGCGGSSGSKAGVVARPTERTLTLYGFDDCCGGFNPVPFSPNGADLVNARLEKKRAIFPGFTAF